MKLGVVLAAAVAALMTLPTQTAAAPDGRDRKVLVENISSQTLRELYASPVSSKNWEEDLLGQRTVAAGSNLEANIDNGTNECIYDLKAVMANGREHIKRGVDVCKVSKWVVGDSGSSIQ